MTDTGIFMANNTEELKTLKDMRCRGKWLNDNGKVDPRIYVDYDELKAEAIKRWKLFNREYKLTGKLEFKGRCNELEDMYNLTEEELKND